MRFKKGDRQKRNTFDAIHTIHIYPQPFNKPAVYLAMPRLVAEDLQGSLGKMLFGTDRKYLLRGKHKAKIVNPQPPKGGTLKIANR